MLTSVPVWAKFPLLHRGAMKTGVSSRLILVFNRTQTILPWQPSGRYTVTHFQENQTKAGGMGEVI